MEILAATYRTAIFEYCYQAMMLILLMSGPPIILASVIGLFVAIIQAATQIQEQTFAFAVKMVAVVGTIMLTGGWLGSLITQFTLQILNNFYKLKS
ncbi:MAG: type III secretion system export apparatus subunit SctS [Verrucomicrobia bacterium]|nr:type III secretion system export apparatus subunit SctS [Verrucomicrobiota bacterium]MBS0646289.1 type III secretion system export apparatus subunit SctS [Verrucomicrobiota bacterium]